MPATLSLNGLVALLQEQGAGHWGLGAGEGCAPEASALPPPLPHPLCGQPLAALAWGQAQEWGALAPGERKNRTCFVPSIALGVLDALQLINPY